MATALRLEIEGMSCDGCVRSVKNALGRVPGVTVGDVVVGTARVSAEGVGEPELGKALEKAGFSLRRVTTE